VYPAALQLTRLIRQELPVKSKTCAFLRFFLQFMSNSAKATGADLFVKPNKNLSLAALLERELLFLSEFTICRIWL
jgi:hypothetical protein